MTFLAPFKVTPKKVNMILKKFGNESVDIIRHRPYMLSAVKGFGFLTVDAIGRQCCCALNDPMRISGCIGHIMNQAMKEGHLFKQRQEVIREALEMLNRDLQVMAVSEQDVSQVLYRLVLQKSIVVEEERIYSIRQYEEETQTASMIARRLLEKPVLLSIEPELEKAQKTLGITLSETQKQAVRMVFAHPISIITGGPGTGKTTVLKVILYIHQALCRSEVQLMAPTGRAARRMVESTGCENASTMHLALGLLGDDTDFEPDFEYLSAGFLNVDEVSMVDMHLAYEFFRRVSRHARVLLVGDKNQLPSVGAGDVFRQLIACGLIPVTVLDLVYRQGALSSIPYNAKLMQENKTIFDIHQRFIYRNFPFPKIYIIPCKPKQFSATHSRSECYLYEILVYSLLCVFQYFPLFFHSQYPYLFCLCFGNFHSCTWVECKNPVMHCIFEHSIENIIHIPYSLCAVIIICHILKQTFQNNRIKICHTLFSYLLLYVTSVKIIITYLCTLLDSPLLMGIQPDIKPCIQSDIIALSFQPMLDFIA